MNVTKTKSLALAAAVGAALVTQAVATPLGAGGVVIGPPLAAAPGGAPIATLTDGFANILYSGVVQTWVYNDPGYNPSGLTFVYQVRLDPNVPGSRMSAIRRHSDFDWNGFASDVNQDDVGGTLQTAGSADRSLTGSTLGWNFGIGAFLEGESSALLIVKTDANAYQAGVGGVIDGVTSNVDIYVPDRVVTGPDGGSTAVLLGAGLIGIGLFRKRLNA